MKQKARLEKNGEGCEKLGLEHAWPGHPQPSFGGARGGLRFVRLVPLVPLTALVAA